MRDAVTAVSIFTLGDCAAQQIEHGSVSELATLSLDRTASSALLGLVWGGGISPWAYRECERLFPGRQPWALTKKIALSTAILGCAGNWCLIFGKRLLITGNAGEAPAPPSILDRVQTTAQSVNADWITVMSYDLRIWPPADLLVYTIVPINLRVAFVSCVSVCWQAYLSYTASLGTAALAAPSTLSGSTLLRRESSRPPKLRDSGH